MTETEEVTPVPFHASYVRAAGLHAVEIDGETVVYVESTESLHLLDTTATIVWQALDDSLTLDELCDDLAVAFGTDAEQIRADVGPLVRRLSEARLITVGG